MEYKKNRIDWYPFEPNAKILEMENHLETTKENRYDYVILRGTLGHANQLFLGRNPEEQLLEYAKKKVKENGKILIAVDNKIGVKNYCEVQQTKKQGKKYNRKQIEELLEKSGFIYSKFYYPLPNWETANVIFTDEFLPNQENLVRNISLHEKEDILLQSENEMFFDLLEQDKNLFKQFANSYWIECSQKEFPNNQIKFVSFSNMRKPQYAIRTVIRGDKVYKTAENEQAKEQIERMKENIQLLEKLGFASFDSYQKDVIISQYQKQESFDHTLMKQLKEGKKEEAQKWMIQFFQEIKEKLKHYQTNQNILDQYEIPYEVEQIKNLTFTKYGLWDLIFQNAFYIEGKFFFYDQEWLEDGVPIEYIFYRSVQYTQGLKEEMDVEKILQPFGINKQHFHLFAQLDAKLQEKTRNNQVWIKHTQGQTLQDLKAQIEHEKQEYQKVLEDCKTLLNQKDARICFLEENMDTTVKLLHQKENEVEQKENKIAQMENSMSWKVTKPLRSIRKKRRPQ